MGTGMEWEEEEVGETCRMILRLRAATGWVREEEVGEGRVTVVRECLLVSFWPLSFDLDLLFHALPSFEQKARN